MKKVFCILSVLMITNPLWAAAADVNKEPAHADPATLAIAEPGYALATADAAIDGNVASAGYVKGAYNSVIKAVNTVSNNKQDVLNSGAGGNITESSGTAGIPVVGISATNGTVSVQKAEVTIPVGSVASPTSRAQIWIQ